MQRNCFHLSFSLSLHTNENDECCWQCSTSSTVHPYAWIMLHVKLSFMNRHLKKSICSIRSSMNTPNGSNELPIKSNSWYWNLGALKCRVNVMAAAIFLTFTNQFVSMKFNSATDVFVQIEAYAAKVPLSLKQWPNISNWLQRSFRSIKISLLLLIDFRLTSSSVPFFFLLSLFCSMIMTNYKMYWMIRRTGSSDTVGMRQWNGWEKCARHKRSLLKSKYRDICHWEWLQSSQTECDSCDKNRM